MAQNQDIQNVPAKWAVELEHISKLFGDVVANADINLQVRPGSIHGIIGENGAGKSTAMKILYGLFPPTSGMIKIDGQVCKWRSPRDAMASGLGMVHQHFMLAGPYSVLDNIVLGSGPFLLKNFPLSFNLIHRSKALEKLNSLASKLSLKVDFSQKIEDLPVGVQQKIEILKLLYNEAKILILDEPTAVLTPQEITDLFSQLRKLRDEGKTILVITHKLKEVMDLTDHITVFRGGKISGHLKTTETNEQELANLMVGRKVVLQVELPKTGTGGWKDGEEDPLFQRPLALEIKNLCLPAAHGKVLKSALKNINLKIQPGEIVGIAGIEGNGQSELIKTLLFPPKLDVHAASGMEIKILGHDIQGMSPFQVKNLGVGVIPEDRQKEGLLLDFSLKENFLLGLHRFKEYQKQGFIKKRQLEKRTQKALEEFDIRPRMSKIFARNLSGGNQQKLIVAREFSRQGRFLICAQPTRGVDVGAIEFIHQQILLCRQEGVGILLISSELQEIMTLSDRIVVMYEGELVAEGKRGDWDEKTIGLYMGGAKRVNGQRARDK